MSAGTLFAPPFMKRKPAQTRKIRRVRALQNQHRGTRNQQKLTIGKYIETQRVERARREPGGEAIVGIVAAFLFAFVGFCVFAESFAASAVALANGFYAAASVSFVAAGSIFVGWMAKDATRIWGEILGRWITRK